MSSDGYIRWLAIEWSGLVILVTGLYLWFGLGVSLTVLGLCIAIQAVEFEEEFGDD